ncbi:hypothetical protein [Kitasatospora sp. NPDC057198]|uniref:hypothetical protein n=1 Tax=Kitasatospora sp. NPDC057198 TaxID=3346046 RepID=UPI0036254A6F
MRIRTAAKAVSALALAGGLALGLSGSAFAVTGLTNLTGKGCPSSYTNNYNGGFFTQVLTKRFVAANGLAYGDYSVLYHAANGSVSSYPKQEYRCY